MFDKLLEGLTTLIYSSARSIHGKTVESKEQEIIHERRRTVKHKGIQLPHDILEVTTADHYMKIYFKGNTCKYCSYNIVYFRSNGSTGTPFRVGNMYQVC